MSRKLSKLPPEEEGVVADFLKGDNHFVVKWAVQEVLVSRTESRQLLYRMLNDLVMFTIVSFLDMERSHGDLTPAVMKKMVRLEGYQPLYNQRGQRQRQLFKGRTQNQQGILKLVGILCHEKLFYRFRFLIYILLGSLRSLGSFEPTTAMNPSVLPFKLGNSQSETFSNTESDLGEENPSYTSNPLPEYDYKELKYNLPTTTENEYNDETEDYSKSLGQDFDGGFESRAGDGEGEQASEGVGSLVGKKGVSLINEIGRRVLMNILQKQNIENRGEQNAKNIPELLEAPSVNSVDTNSFNSETKESHPSHNEGSVLSSLEQNNMHAAPSQNFNNLQNLMSSNQAMHSINSSPSNQDIAKVISELGMKALSKTKLAVSQEPQSPVENVLNSKVPGDISSMSVSDVTVGGKVNNVIDSTKQSSAQVTTKPTLRATADAERRADSKVNSDVANSSKEDVVILKISGQGKPISFRADTSIDGSLVLKIPKQYSEKIIQSDDIQGPATVTKSDGAGAHPGDVSQDVSALLAGKNPRNGLFGETTQISDWEISGKKNEGNKDFQENSSLTDFHPTRNVLPSDPKQTIRLLLLKSQEPLSKKQENSNQNPKTLVQSPVPETHPNKLSLKTWVTSQTLLRT